MSISEVVLPWAIAFAAGAMLYVISVEIAPERHRRGPYRRATRGSTIGLCVMKFLDDALG